MIYIQYIMLVIGVVGLSLYLSKYVDELDKLTDLSGAFIGGVLLAAVTSLPEFITSITSVKILDEPDLVQGNVLGSNIFNMAIIGMCFLFAGKKFVDSKIEKNHIYTASFVLFLGFVFSLFMKNGLTIGNESFNLNIASICIIIFYVLNLLVLKKDHGYIGSANITKLSQTAEVNCSPYTVGQVITRLIVLASLLVCASVLLTSTTDKLSTQLNLGATVGGAIFLGVATSLPELTSCFNLIRLNNFNAAIGNVVGSNIFNLMVLAFADSIYHKASLYSYTFESSNLLNFGIIANVLVLLAFMLKNNKVAIKIIGLLISMCYVLSIFMSI